MTYNPQGLLSAIDQLHDGTQLENMIYTYDALDRVSTFQSNDGMATYGYDSVDEVTSANYSMAAGGHQPRDESYSFDQNGNRATVEGVTASVAVHNEVSSDGTFTYTFDADGNRLTRTRDSGDPEDDHLVSGLWDARNRLVEVQNFNNAGTLTEQLNYTYDVFDHLIERVDDKIGGSTTTTQYVWDADNIVLSFDNGVLAARYLNGPNTSASDQYFSMLAEENVASGTTTWDLLDAQGSLRDVIDSNGNVIDHLNYNSFGQKIFESAPTVSHIDGYAGGLYDASTQLVYFIHRWYDPAATVWTSLDPAGFAAGDANLARYVGNDATNAADAEGLYNPAVIRAITGALIAGPRADDGEAKAAASSDEAGTRRALGEQWKHLRINMFIAREVDSANDDATERAAYEQLRVANELLAPYCIRVNAKAHVLSASQKKRLTGGDLTFESRTDIRQLETFESTLKTGKGVWNVFFFTDAVLAPSSAMATANSRNKRILVATRRCNVVGNKAALAHEIGHALGLAHTREVTNLMTPPSWDPTKRPLKLRIGEKITAEQGAKMRQSLDLIDQPSEPHKAPSNGDEE